MALQKENYKKFIKNGITTFLLFSLCVSLHAQIITQREYHQIGEKVNKSGMRVVKLDGKYGCIDLSGKEIVPIKYDKITFDEDQEYVITWLDEKWGMYVGELRVLDDVCDNIWPNGIHRVVVYEYDKREVKGLLCYIKYGACDFKGRNLVEPGHYGYISKFDDESGLAAIAYGNDLGFINRNGRIAIPLNYRYIEDSRFIDGIAVVKKAETNEWGAINAQGQPVIPFGKYNRLSGFNGISMWAEKDGNYAILYRDGRVLKELSDKKFNKIGYETHLSYGCFRLKEEYNRKYSKHHKYKEYTFFFDYYGQEWEDEQSAINANKQISRIEKEKKQQRLKNIIDKKLATIKWQNIPLYTQQSDCHIEANVMSDSKIEEVFIYHNGSKVTDVHTAKSVYVRNAAGTMHDERTVIYRKQGDELPTIEWIDFAATAEKKEYQVKLGIKSKTKVEEVNITVNGMLTRGIITVPADGYDLTIDRMLTLNDGINRIVVSAKNGDGIATSEKIITYQSINPTPLVNDKRIALIIGNSTYSSSEMNLNNPQNDAQDVAEKLKGLGFEVMMKLDATLEDIDKELTDFGLKAKDYDVAMFYYAGHGIQSKGVNYLIPTNIKGLAEDNIKYKCVNMERILDTMEDSQCKLKMVVLDACRNNPLARRWHRSAGVRGLSLMDAPMGTIISFSTAPGSTAQDGNGRNSPYTEAFLNTLEQPNLDVFHFFQNVGKYVMDKTGKTQNPWLSSSFIGDFYFNKQ